MKKFTNGNQISLPELNLLDKIKVNQKIMHRNADEHKKKLRMLGVIQMWFNTKVNTH